jgi:hypothetical protein
MFAKMYGFRNKIPGEGGQYSTIGINNSWACKVKKRSVRRQTENNFTVDEVDGAGGDVLIR